MINYGFSNELDIPYERVIEMAREALKKEGFGVLTEIDVKEKMKEKLIGLDAFRGFSCRQDHGRYESADRHKLTAQTKARHKRVAPCYDVVDWKAK
jgi:hypothetical protein